MRGYARRHSLLTKLRQDYFSIPVKLQWRHNERDGVSNHRRHQCLINCWFRRRSNKTPKLRVTGLCAGNAPVTGEFPTPKASNAESVSIWWRYHELGVLHIVPRYVQTDFGFSCAKYKPSLINAVNNMYIHVVKMMLQRISIYISRKFITYDNVVVISELKGISPTE